MSPQRLALRVRLLVPVCLVGVVAACGGGGDSTDAAAKAKAACEVFHGFHPPTATSRKAQINYTKASYVAFLQSAELARKAADEDSRWTALETAAQREAAAFEVIVKATDPKSSADVSSESVTRAVDESNAARPKFAAECDKADPGGLSGGTSTRTPAPGPVATG